MGDGILHSYPENWRLGYRCLQGPHCCSVQWALGLHALHTTPFLLGQTNCTPEFLHNFPPNQVPPFEGNNRFCTFGSNAITYNIVWSRKNYGEAIHRQKLMWCSGRALPIVTSFLQLPRNTCVFTTMGIMYHDKQATAMQRGLWGEIWDWWTHTWRWWLFWW